MDPIDDGCASNKSTENEDQKKLIANEDRFIWKKIDLSKGIDTLSRKAKTQRFFTATT